jgi:peptidoglycan/LPS O-acetylase OafA/YrhL
MSLAEQTIPNAYLPALRGRIPSLDGLRAVSILLVLAGHAAMSDNAPHMLLRLAHAGNVGVRFFFVISGFLITTLLVKEWTKTGTISMRSFYFRRVLRIFPAAYALIAVIALLAASGAIRLKPGEVFYAATFTMNYHDFLAVWLGQLWSLSVEEQFYLLWPGLLLLAGAFRSFRAAWLVVIVCPLLRAVMWFVFHASATAMTKHFESVMDALAIGCLLAGYFNRLGEWKAYRRLQARTGLFLGLALGLIALANGLFIVRPSAFYIWGQSIANVGTVLCIDWAIRNPDQALGRVLNWKPLMFIGTLSYSLYLWQNPFLLGDAGTLWNSFPLNLVCTVAAALGSYFLIERPFLSLKERVESR